MYVQYIGVYHEYIGGIPEVHRGDIMSTSGDIMIYVGEQSDKSLLIYTEHPDVLNIPRCTHDIPRCTHDIPDVLNIP